jgi:hypothetical protein
MNFNDRSSAIHLLQEDAPMIFDRLPECGLEAIRYARESFPALRSACRRRIRCMSPSFMKAYRQVAPRLSGSLLRERVTESGTWILPIDSAANYTVFYNLSLNQDGPGRWTGSVDLVYFLSVPTAPRPYLSSVISILPGGRLVLSESTTRQIGVWPEDLAQDIVSLIIFTRYCETETAIVAPAKRHLCGQEIYQNDTAESIEVLDSTWLSALVRSGSFRGAAEKAGFFRLQRSVPVEERRMAWVQPYELQAIPGGRK